VGEKKKKEKKEQKKRRKGRGNFSTLHWNITPRRAHFPQTMVSYHMLEIERRGGRGE
jgi:hypothetical protein